ncbi:hypothetical protein EZV73_25055 [Acidaminobacter sp. JC074]|uniref:cyanophycinase n=1 Tax=Acidaminobacter sp. JC074 TaxID=2530199 RepID=UPI001F113289|nr:cyanophycinase [Acidaminobacter sp. JC074]MCH4890873.1 hypothetical protein [Acidaminobacter sp. JC074]
MKKILIVLLLLCLLACENQQPLTESGQVVTELSIVSEGKRIDDYQLGFLPGKILEEDFQAWLLLYDHEDFEAVWSKLSGMTIQEIKELSDMDGDNRAYWIDKYDYADGLGNTLNPDQKTFLEGASFNLGIYHFYVVTISKEGVVGLKRAQEVIDVRPLPKEVRLRDRTLEYDIQSDDRLMGHAVFVSKATLYDLKDNLIDKPLKDLKKASDKHLMIMVDKEINSVILSDDLLTLEGEKIEDDVFGVFVASYGQEGLMDIAMANTYLIEKDYPLNNTIHNDGMGTIMLIGGGVASSDSDKIKIFEAMRQAGGEHPRLAILSSSRFDRQAVYNHFYYKDPEFGSFEDNYKNLGFKPVFIPLATDNANQIKNDEYWSGLLESCDGAYLQGGDQYKHVKSLLNDDGTPSKMLLALEKILDRGGFVAGTSAGMAAMGDLAYGYGYSLEALSHNSLEQVSLEAIPEKEGLVSSLEDNNIAVPGIGLVDHGIILDTHFDKRGRLGRLLVALRDSKSQLAIGVDEGTSFNIQNKIGEVIGDQGVFVLDASEAVFGKAGSDEVFLAENIYLHYLTEGDRYDLWTKNVMQEDKVILEGHGLYNARHPVFEKDYTTTKLLIDFIHSENQVLEVPYKLVDGSVITIAFEKAEKTKAYTSNLDYKDSSLEGYKKASIEGMLMHVYEFRGQDKIPPVISYMKAYTRAYKVYLGITDNLSGIDEDSINEETVQFISDVNSLYEAPFYDLEYKEIGIIIAEEAFVKGDKVIVDGVKDTAGNVVEKQTWEFDGTTWYRK